jgi:hypothetical protein
MRDGEREGYTLCINDLPILTLSRCAESSFRPTQMLPIKESSLKLYYIHTLLLRCPLLKPSNYVTQLLHWFFGEKKLINRFRMLREREVSQVKMLIFPQTFSCAHRDFSYTSICAFTRTDIIQETYIKTWL